MPPPPRNAGARAHALPNILSKTATVMTTITIVVAGGTVATAVETTGMNSSLVTVMLVPA